MRFIILAISCLFFPVFALAQVVAPIPQPRIIRDAQSAPSQIDLPEQTQPIEQPAPTPDIPTPNQPVSLSAKVQLDGAIIPNGLIWRIFATETDETGQLPLIARSEEATASFNLPVGQYMVHVSYGRAQSSDTLEVGIGPNIKSIILEAGALRLRSTINTEVNIPPTELKFDVFTDSIDGDEIPVAMDIEQNAMVHLNAGTYTVVSRWGDQNAMVRADIRVEPGEVTEATLFHKAAKVTFSLVSKAGGEAIADVDWKVQSAEGETIYTYFGAFPATVLAQGDYSVFAQVGETVYNRQFQSMAGRPLHFEVLTSVY